MGNLYELPKVYARVVANLPDENVGYESIENLIGREFLVLHIDEKDQFIVVYDEDCDILLNKGEYVLFTRYDD